MERERDRGRLTGREHESFQKRRYWRFSYSKFKVCNMKKFLAPSCYTDGAYSVLGFRHKASRWVCLSPFSGTLTLGSVTLYHAGTRLSPDCPLSHSHRSSHNQTWAQLPCLHMSSGLTVVAAQWRTTWRTLLYWLFLGLFCVVLVKDGCLMFLDYLIIQGGMICTPMFVLMHEQPYDAEAHLVHLFQGQERVSCLGTVQRTHTSQSPSVQ